MAIVSKVKNDDVRDYLEEGLKCLQVGALRAAVVFIWVAAIRTIHNNLIAYNKTDLNNAIQKHDPQAKTVSKIDDFAYIKDKVVLLASVDLGAFEKSKKDVLEEALNLRNKCGHPAKYNPGIKKVSGFVEDIVSVLFPLVYSRFCPFRPPKLAPYPLTTDVFMNSCGSGTYIINLPIILM